MKSARIAKRDYMSALRLMRPGHPDWQPPVVMTSALECTGIDVLWEKVLEHRRIFDDNGELQARRRDQMHSWMWSMVDRRVLAAVRSHPEVAALAATLEAEVLAGTTTPTLGAQALLKAFGIALPEQ